MSTRRNAPLHIAFVWNMHQPYYKDLATSEYMLPWVRMHGVKDYYSIAHILRNFPDIHQTFNLVPSLLKQIDDYTTQGLFNIKETSLRLTLKPANELTKEDKVYLLYNFFMANWHNMVYPNPRFGQLLDKRGHNITTDELKKIQSYFSTQEYLDLQIWGNLCWIDPFFKSDPRIQDLFNRGENFREEDKITLINVQEEIMALIIPEYRSLAQSGQIELITSPLYHPILPLLCDSEHALAALPELKLPTNRFIHPEDALSQLEKGIAVFKEITGITPQGMWPSEGSVCEQIVPMIARSGIKWIATDEQILAKSLNLMLERNYTDTLKDPRILYQPYLFEQDGEQLTIIFRDHLLSDIIGFDYARENSQSAANNLIRRLLTINDHLPHEGDYLVTILLDGENAWEYFTNNGQDFLASLYEGITKEPRLKAVTVNEYLEQHPPKRHLNSLFSGSWIDHNFKIWIGHEEDNSGWDQIEMTRNALVNYQKKHPEANPELLETAWEKIYIAEGSDWFWWYGDEHNSANVEMFDNLFRRHLVNVYNSLGVEVPDRLYITNIVEKKYCVPEKEPRGFISPIIDGDVTNYFEWLAAGSFDVSINCGTTHQAMHQNVDMISGLFFGFDHDNLFLRVDFSKSCIQDVLNSVIFINFTCPNEYYFKIQIVKKNVALNLYKRLDSNDWTLVSSKAQVAIDRILEIKIPLDEIGVSSGDKLHIIISIESDGVKLERWPGKGYMLLAVPDKDFEAHMWQV